MAFEVKINADASQLVGEAARAEASLNKAGQAGARAGDQAAAGHAKAARAATEHGDSIGRLIQLASAYVAVHQFESIIDGYIEVRNKTNSVATSMENTNALLEEQFRIAQETRSSWEGLASTYQRISNAGRGLGLSQREILDLTEELSMGMRLSGSNSREAAMTMMELTHAFTVGTLTGREFRVMMKDAPALMHELQVASGKTGAEFAEMGKHGKFTAQALVEWFGKAAPEIRAKFGETLPTIAEGFQLIRNAATKFFGEAAIGSGLMARLSGAMKFVADNFETIGRVALAVAEALGGLFVIEKITTMVRALTAAIALNPIGALLIALTTGVMLLREFGDQIETGRSVWIPTLLGVGSAGVSVRDDLYALWQQLKDLGAAALELVSGAWSSLTGALSGGVDSAPFKFSLDEMLRSTAEFIGRLRGLFTVVREDGMKIFGGLAVVLGEAFIDVGRGIAQAFGWLINKLIDGLNALGSVANTVSDAVLAKWDVQKVMQANMMQEGAARDAMLKQAKISSGPQLGKIGHVDFDFKNPLAGAAGAQGQLMRDAANTVNQAGRDAVIQFDRDSAARAVERAREAAGKQRGSVSAVGGAKDAAIHDEKAAKEAEKLLNKWREMVAASNPVAAAEEHIRKAREVGTKALAAGITTIDEYNQVMTDMARKQEDALHPFDAWVRKQGEASAALRINTDEQERAAELVKFTESMREKQSGGATQAEIATATALIERTQEHAKVMRVEQDLYTRFRAPAAEYALQIKAAGDLLERGTITAKQYAEATDDVRAAYLKAQAGSLSLPQQQEQAWLEAKIAARQAGVEVEDQARVYDELRLKQLGMSAEGRTMAGAWESAWIKMRHEADAFGATLANQLLGDLDKLNDALITAANGGEVSWSKMADSMIQDLERILIKAIEVKAITALLNMIAPGSGSVAEGAGVTGAVVNSVNSSASSPLSSAPVSMGAGTGSASSAVTVAQPAPTAAPTTIQIINHQDGSSQGAYLASRAGQRVVNNTLRRIGVGMKG